MARTPRTTPAATPYQRPLVAPARKRIAHPAAPLQRSLLPMPNPPSPPPDDAIEQLANYAQRLNRLGYRQASVPKLQEIISKKPHYLPYIDRALMEYQANPMCKQWLETTFGKPEPGDTEAERIAAALPPAPPVSEQAAQPPTPSQTPLPTSTPTHRRSEHFYAKSAALCLDLNLDGPTPKLFLDAASASAPGHYDWQNKTTLMLSYTDAAQLLLVATGHLQTFESRYHGEAKGVSFKATDQGASLYAVVTAKGAGLRAVPVTAADRLRLADQCLALLQAIHPSRSLADWLLILPATVLPRSAPSSSDNQPV